MGAAQEHLRTKHMSRHRTNPLHTDMKTFKGHRQLSEENLHRWGFTNTDIKSDSIPMRQSWQTAYHVDEWSFDENNPNRGRPELDADYIKMMEIPNIEIPLRSQKKWEIYTDGSK